MIFGISFLIQYLFFQVFQHLFDPIHFLHFWMLLHALILNIVWHCSRFQMVRHNALSTTGNYLNTSLKIPHDNIKFEKSQRVTLTQWPLKEERPLNKSITFINFVKMIWSKNPQCPLHIILLGSHPFDCGLMAKLWGLDFCWISLQIPIPGNFHFFYPGFVDKTTNLKVHQNSCLKG